MENLKETDGEGSLAAQIAELREMPIGELNECYLQSFGAKPRVVYRQYLVRRIAWKLQAVALGGLSPATLTRAAEIARNISFEDTPALAVETRSSAKQKQRHRDKRQPEPGSQLTRIYKDRRIVAKVIEDGFEYDGKQYRSLSAVARAATGTPWNGLVFFGLAKRGDTAKAGKKTKPAEVREVAHNAA